MHVDPQSTRFTLNRLPVCGDTLARACSGRVPPLAFTGSLWLSQLKRGTLSRRTRRDPENPP